MNYGLPYKGSKNKIAEWVVSNFPQKDNFYDLFAGGCAITHCAMLQNKFKTYSINDVLDIPQLFVDAINGKYKNETRWISREDFFRLKDTDPYIKTCWSFGNNGKGYMYSREIEPWKKAVHFARVFNDFSLLESFGIKSDGSRKDIKEHHSEYKEKYIKWYMKNVLMSRTGYDALKNNLETKIKDESEKLRQYLLNGLKVAGKKQSDVDRFLGTQMSGHYFGRSQWAFPTREEYIKLQSFLYLPQDYDEIVGLQTLYQSLQSLERLQRLQSLESLQSLQSLERLNIFKGSYKDVPIKQNSLIYCDIPYKNTDAYDNDFDYEEFYTWAENQTEPVIISEYSCPLERFTILAAQRKTVCLSAVGTSYATEFLFVPTKQIENGIFKIKNKIEQLELF